MRDPVPLLTSFEAASANEEMENTETGDDDKYENLPRKQHLSIDFPWNRVSRREVQPAQRKREQVSDYQQPCNPWDQAGESNRFELYPYFLLHTDIPMGLS